eukprot:4123409-Pyramimonas_sp.AAC.1
MQCLSRRGALVPRCGDGLRKGANAVWNSSGASPDCNFEQNPAVAAVAIQLYQETRLQRDTARGIEYAIWSRNGVRIHKTRTQRGIGADGRLDSGGRREE